MRNAQGTCRIFPALGAQPVSFRIGFVCLSQQSVNDFLCVSVVLCMGGLSLCPASCWPGLTEGGLVPEKVK